MSVDGLVLSLVDCKKRRPLPTQTTQHHCHHKHELIEQYNADGKLETKRINKQTHREAEERMQVIGRKVLKSFKNGSRNFFIKAVIKKEKISGKRLEHKGKETSSVAGGEEHGGD